MTAAVVFDVDDTLYLERDYVRSGFSAVGCHARARWGVVGLGDTCWSLFLGGHRATTFDTALARHGVAPDGGAVAELVEVYRSHPPSITMRSDAVSAVEALGDRMALGIITDGPARSQWAKIDALAACAWSSCTVVTAELGPNRGKPHPAAFERVARSLGCAHGDMVYVGDNPAKDFVAPRDLGWTTIRLRCAGQLHRDVPSGGDVTHEVALLTELVDIVGTSS